MKVYLASHFSRKSEVKQAADEFTALGINVVSTWHKEKTPSNAVMHRSMSQEWRKNAITDLGELVQCTHFVLFSMGPTRKFSRGSHCWEAGAAFAMNKNCLTVGEPQYLFHHLPGEHIVRTWNAAKRYLKKELKNEHNEYPTEYVAPWNDSFWDDPI